MNFDKEAGEALTRLGFAITASPPWMVHNVPEDIASIMFHNEEGNDAA